MSLTVNLDWPLQQLDVENVFFNGHLENEAYMEIPQEFENNANIGKVCKLRKSLYGLKQSLYGLTSSQGLWRIMGTHKDRLIIPCSSNIQMIEK